jgi:hypothetical protein
MHSHVSYLRKCCGDYFDGKINHGITSGADGWVNRRSSNGKHGTVAGVKLRSAMANIEVP